MEGMISAYAKLGRYGEAVSELQSAIGRQPNCAQLHGWLAWTYEQMGDSEAAQKENALFVRLERESVTAVNLQRSPSSSCT
jgi:Flp pilus assembly protein TadD